MTAKIDNQEVLIPKEGLAPMLFLEFIRDETFELLITRLKIAPDNSDNYFRIKIFRQDKNYNNKLINYINSNS